MAFLNTEESLGIATNTKFQKLLYLFFANRGAFISFSEQKITQKYLYWEQAIVKNIFFSKSNIIYVHIWCSENTNANIKIMLNKPEMKLLYSEILVHIRKQNTQLYSKILSHNSPELSQRFLHCSLLEGFYMIERSIQNKTLNINKTKLISPWYLFILYLTSRSMVLKD